VIYLICKQLTFAVMTVHKLAYCIDKIHNYWNSQKADHVNRQTVTTGADVKAVVTRLWHYIRFNQRRISSLDLSHQKCSS